MRRRREHIPIPGYQTPSRHSPSINDFGFQRTHAREQIRKAAPPKFHAKRLSKPHTCAQAETNQRHMGGSRQPQSCRSCVLFSVVWERDRERDTAGRFARKRESRRENHPEPLLARRRPSHVLYDGRTPTFALFGSRREYRQLGHDHISS